MRDLSANAVAKIAENLGNEPIYIIEIQWTRDGTIYSYADRTIPLANIRGQILEVGDLDAVILVSDNSDSQAVNVLLDDSNGEIKTIMDQNDIHQRDAWIYQWFEGLPLDDKFLLFKGKISSPITWNEGNRTVGFEILSTIEDMEVGFSPEEGDFDNIPNNMLGKAWPMVFGTCTYIHSIRLDQAAIGTLADGIGIADPSLQRRIDALKLQIIMFRSYQQLHMYYAALAGLDNNDSAKEYNLKIANTAAASWFRRQQDIDDTLLPALTNQETTVKSSFRFFNSGRIPTGEVTMYVKGSKSNFESPATIVGHKDESEFFITEITHPVYIEEPDIQLTYCDSYQYDTDGNLQRGEGYSQTLPWLKGYHDAGYWYAKPGTNIYLVADEPQKYIVSIVPGSVLGVYAMIQREGQKFMSAVSPNLWRTYIRSYGSVSAVIVEINNALSKELNLGFEDEIYVDFRSDVGPNVVNVLSYLIGRYSDLYIDSASFNEVSGYVAAYPCSFVFQKRMNLVQILKEIAWQARCQIRLIDDVFYLTYLPRRPAPVDTITEADIDVDSIEVSYSSTENLVTKMICDWYATGAQEEPNTVILRHNTAKYGSHEQNYDFYIYNNAGSVIKAATFWLIRYANTWKSISFSTPVHKLKLETLDAVNLAFTNNYIATGNIVAIIQDATYSSDNRQIDFTCWTGVKAGTMTQYDFAFPAGVDSTESFPTAEEIADGLDGGFGNNKAATGTLTNTNDDRYTQQYIVTQFNILKRRYSDKGDPTPSDSGDSYSTLPATTVPILSLNAPAQSTPAFVDPTTYDEDVAQPASLTSIDLHTTTITDSSVAGSPSSTLGTFFHSISPDGDLAVNDTTIRTDGTNYANYIVKLDTGLNLFGAGLAFLYNDEEEE